MAFIDYFFCLLKKYKLWIDVFWNIVKVFEKFHSSINKTTSIDRFHKKENRWEFIFQQFYLVVLCFYKILICIVFRKKVKRPIGLCLFQFLPKTS